MNRRSNHMLYFSEEILSKLIENKPLKAWDIAGLFFPRDTSRKQFDCAFKFLTELDKKGEMLNTDVRRIMQEPKEQVMLMSHVLPKLQTFRLIETDAENGSRKYNIKFARGFTNLIHGLEMDWLVFYARHTNGRD